MHAEELIEYIKIPKWDRIFRIKDALMANVSVSTISKATGIDRWFINEVRKLSILKRRLPNTNWKHCPLDLLEAKPKQFGFQRSADLPDHEGCYGRRDV